MAEPAERLVLGLRLGRPFERDQRLDATGLFVLLRIVALVAAAMVLRGGLFATRRAGCACARMAGSWRRRRRRGGEGKCGVGSFGAAGVAAEIGVRVDESADFAGPETVVGFGRVGGEVDDRGRRCWFGGSRYRRCIIQDCLWC